MQSNALTSTPGIGYVYNRSAMNTYYYINNPGAQSFYRDANSVPLGGATPQWREDQPGLEGLAVGIYATGTPDRIYHSPYATDNNGTPPANFSTLGATNATTPYNYDSDGVRFWLLGSATGVGGKDDCAVLRVAIPGTNLYTKVQIVNYVDNRRFTGNLSMNSSGVINFASLGNTDTSMWNTALFNYNRNLYFGILSSDQSTITNLTNGYSSVSALNSSVNLNTLVYNNVTMNGGPTYFSFHGQDQLTPVVNGTDYDEQLDTTIYFDTYYFSVAMSQLRPTYQSWMNYTGLNGYSYSLVNVDQNYTTRTTLVDLGQTLDPTGKPVYTSDVLNNNNVLYIKSNLKPSVYKMVSVNGIPIGYIKVPVYGSGNNWYAYSFNSPLTSLENNVVVMNQFTSEPKVSGILYSDYFAPGLSGSKFSNNFFLTEHLRKNDFAPNFNRDYMHFKDAGNTTRSIDFQGDIFKVNDATLGQNRFKGGFHWSLGMGFVYDGNSLFKVSGNAYYSLKEQFYKGGDLMVGLKAENFSNIKIKNDSKNSRYSLNGDQNGKFFHQINLNPYLAWQTFETKYLRHTMSFGSCFTWKAKESDYMEKNLLGGSEYLKYFSTQFSNYIDILPYGYKVSDYLTLPSLNIAYTNKTGFENYGKWAWNNSSHEARSVTESTAAIDLKWKLGSGIGNYYLTTGYAFTRYLLAANPNNVGPIFLGGLHDSVIKTGHKGTLGFQANTANYGVHNIKGSFERHKGENGLENYYGIEYTLSKRIDKYNTEVDGTYGAPIEVSGKYEYRQVPNQSNKDHYVELSLKKPIW